MSLNTIQVALKAICIVRSGMTQLDKTTWNVLACSYEGAHPGIPKQTHRYTQTDIVGVYSRQNLPINLTEDTGWYTVINIVHIETTVASLCGDAELFCYSIYILSQPCQNLPPIAVKGYTNPDSEKKLDSDAYNLWKIQQHQRWKLQCGPPIFHF